MSALRGFKFSVNYNQLTSLLTKALQYVYQQVKDLDTQAARREKELAAMKTENEQLRQKTTHLEAPNFVHA